jgi:D-psicose/D-tagatose/L-ribulose 3-epimerase
MKLQYVDEVREQIKLRFEAVRKSEPGKLERRLELSFSNWVFGLETLEEAVRRLAKYKVRYIELGGDYGGRDVGYQAETEKTKALLDKYDVKCSGICGFFGDSNALSTNNNFIRQTAREYIIKEVEFCKAVGGTYMLVVPGTVGRSVPYDSSDYARSVLTLRSVADVFVKYNIRCAVEPINSAEVPICSTVASVRQYIRDVNHPGVQHINGDIFHMLCGERNIPEAILDAGSQLINLHVEDTNRMPLGNGMMDMDTIIRALYLLGYNRDGCFVTGEPLGPGRDSYAIMFGQHTEEAKEQLVADTVRTFREREEAVLS